MSRRVESIERICSRASIGTVIATVIVLFIALFVASYQDLQFLRESESKVLALSAPRIMRALSSELMLGDERSVQAIKAELQKELNLSALDLSLEPIQCDSAVFESCWSGAIGEVKPVRYVRFSVPVKNGGILQGAEVLLWAFLPIVLIAVFISYRVRKDLNRAVVEPILALVKDPEKWSPDGRWIAKEVLALRDLLVQHIRDREMYFSERERLRIQASIGELALQVAHDIRSPLAALEVVANVSGGMPEENRILVQSAISRIREIAEDLLQRNATDEGRDALSQRILPEYLPDLIELIITEKKLRWKESGVALESRLVNGFGIFASVDSSEFKRVLSNLLDNAIEACTQGGKVAVYLDEVDGLARVRVRDNGKGIPSDLLPQIGLKGSSHGKVGGSGLGLFHAKTRAAEWGGRLEINSEVGQGTCVSLSIPKAVSPSWFVPSLEIPTGSQILVLDDDQSVHRAWSHRFDALVAQNSIKPLLHFSKPLEVEEWLRGQANQNFLLLADLELRGFSGTGLDVILKSGIQERAILVTSSWNDRSLLAKCVDQGVRVLPKAMAALVPIRLKLDASGFLDAVLIDDDPLVRSVWEFEARRQKKAVLTFPDIASFDFQMSGIGKDTPIYLDSCLGAGDRGEAYAEKLFGRGFTNLFLATGRPVSDSDLGLPYLRGVVGKEPPFALLANNGA